MQLKHTRLLILSVVILFTTTLQAQSKKKKSKDDDETEVSENKPLKKLEIDFDNTVPYYQVAMLGNQGLILMVKDKNIFTLYKYDSELKKTYKVDLDIETRYTFSNYIHKDKKLYLLFAEGTSPILFKKFRIIEFDIETKKSIIIDDKFEKYFTMNKMEELKGKIYLFGSNTISNGAQLGRMCLTISACYIPVFFGLMNFPGWANVATVDFGKKETTFEILDYGKKPHIRMLSSSINEEKKTANILVKDNKSKKETFMYLQSLNLSKGITPGDPIELNVGEKYEAFTAKVNYSSENERLVVGCFGDKVSKAVGGTSFPITKGVYISKIDKSKVLWSKNILYTQIFKRDNVTDNTKKKKKKSKKTDEQLSAKNMQVLFHDVIESDEQYIFIGETYYPTFHTETRTTYSNGQWTTTTVTIFDGYVYNECVAFATDKKGNYQWSSLFKLPYYRTFYPTRELVKINPIGDKLAVTNFNKGFLVTYFLDEEGFTQKDDDTKVNLTKKDDKLNSRSSNLEIWYDNYYLAYGEISLRAKKKGDNGKKNRQFIYLYKMEIGSEYKDEKSED